MLFRPTCGYGGTYFDADRDYIYYGPKERELLVNSRWPNGSWEESEMERSLWTKDRQSVPKIVVHHTESRCLNANLLLVTSWCNERAKDVLLLGPKSPSLKEGTMLSDLGKSLRSFGDQDIQTLERIERLRKTLQIVRPLFSFWKNFKPRRIVSASLFSTDNVEQKMGFIEEFHLNRRVHLMFDSELALDREDDWAVPIPLA